VPTRLSHELVGQEVFNRIVGGFYREYQAVGATTDQFADYVRAVAPDQQRLMEDWLYTTGWTVVIAENGTLSGIALYIVVSDNPSAVVPATPPYPMQRAAGGN
jgi:hypothetical protein